MQTGKLQGRYAGIGELLGRKKCRKGSCRKDWQSSKMQGICSDGEVARELCSQGSYKKDMQVGELQGRSGNRGVARKLKINKRNIIN